MSVRRLRVEVGDSTELAGWMAFLELEPPHAESWQMAAMQSLNARRIAGDKKARLKDFLPQPPAKVESAGGMLQKLRALFPGSVHGIQPDATVADEFDDDEV